MNIKKIFISLIIIISISLITQINPVQAALQANGDTIATKDRNTWMIEVRKMESLGGTLGLTETQNADLTSSSGSNKLDIHMQKNTEYGAMALLSASAYGKPTKVENGETTTGNETGVIISYNKEWTAAQYTEHISGTSYADRYINYYNLGSSNKKRGDALLETAGWHSTTYVYYSNGLCPGTAGTRAKPAGVVRNCNNGIFSFNNALGYYYWEYGGWINANVPQDRTASLHLPYTTRAVIINGEGI